MSGVKVGAKDATYGVYTFPFNQSGREGAVGKDKKVFLSKHTLGWEAKRLSLNLEWTQEPPALHRITANAIKGTLTKLHKHALVYPFVIPLSPLTPSQTVTHPLSLSPSPRVPLGLGVTWRKMPSIIWHSTRRWTTFLAPLFRFPSDRSLFSQRRRSSLEHLRLLIRSLIRLMVAVQGNRSPCLLTLSTVVCFTVDLFWSILLPVSHFNSSISAAFDFCHHPFC